MLLCKYKILEINRNRRDVHLFMDSFFWGGGFEVIFSLMFVIVIGMFVVVAVKGIGPVSYTHLDVYKRQGRRDSIIST